MTWGDKEIMLIFVTIMRDVCFELEGCVFRLESLTAVNKYVHLDY